MTDTPDKALAALGTRLREIRKAAGLLGRELAELAGWHPSKVTRIELAKQRPSEEDISVWCRICEASQDEPDLRAAVQSIESMYIDLRRTARTGLKPLQDSFNSLWGSTSTFRIYEPFIIPGLFQTATYARSILAFSADRLKAPDDIEAAVASRLARQEVLHEGDRRFISVIEEQALYSRLGDSSIMMGQLDRLMALMSSQRCSIGVIPMMATRHVLPSEGFWIYDESKVMIETRSAIVTFTQPSDIQLYAEIFERLQRSAAYGPQARELIMTALRRHDQQSKQSPAIF
jgi:transcriptional regulator with XRE-family HTH domain